MTTDSVYLACFISLLTISTARGNYGYGQRYGSQICDRNVYDRAKEMIRIEMQQRGGGGGNNRSPYDSRYPAMTNSYQGGQNYSNGNYLNEQVNDHQCKLMRQAFDDLLIHTPLCESINSYPFQQSADLILQSRKFLAQYCERNQGWQYAQCFKRREIQECENQYSYMKQARQGSYSGTGTFNSQNSPYNQPYNQIYNQQPVTYELCQAFETFRNCVITNSRNTCYTNDLDYLGTYFADKAMNASWSCLPNQIDNSGYIRRTDPYLMSAGGVGVGGVNPNYPIRSGYDINNPLNPSQQYPPFQGAGVPLGPFPPSGINVGTNDIDRVGGALSGVQAGSVSACIERVRPYESSCLDFLVQRQREARYGRSSTDVQRRICCALFRYRDCLSRVVLERCFDNSRVTVDILMGDRNREITQTCRDITRDQCNGVPNSLSSNLILFISIGLVSMMFTSNLII